MRTLLLFADSRGYDGGLMRMRHIMRNGEYVFSKVTLI